MFMKYFALCISICSIAHAEDWPHWRGPQRNGVSAEKGWLDAWPAAGPATAWKAKVGLGFSGFVVAQGRAYTLGHAEGVRNLPHHHGDPFDRLLVSQATIEGLTLVSADRQLEPYRIPVLWT